MKMPKSAIIAKSARNGKLIVFYEYIMNIKPLHKNAFKLTATLQVYLED